VLLWIFVANLENPARITSYTGIPIEARNLPANFKLINPPQEVSVTIEAPQSVLETLSRSDVQAYVDVGGLNPGVHNVPLRADFRGVALNGNNSTLRFDPPSVQVQIEEEVRRELGLDVVLLGTPAFGYGTEPPQTNPKAVQAIGVSDAIDRINRLVVEVDIEDKAGTQQGTRQPKALDEAGNVVEGVTFEPANVTVIVPVKLLLNYKVVPVRVPVPGQPAAGFRVTAINYDPTNVTVCCKPDILEQLQFIDTLPVDINGATSTVITQTDLILPSEVELYPGQPRTISVTVNIEALVTTLQLSVATSIEGEQPGSGVVVSPNRLDIVLEGTFSQLQGLTPSDVRAVVNLQGRGPGTYTLRPQIVVPLGVTIQSSSPETLNVTVLAPTAVPTATPPPPTITPIPTAVPTDPPEPTSQPTSPLATPSATATRTPSVIQLTGTPATQPTQSPQPSPPPQ
jgi:YbbR domain-containing protein